MSVRYSPSPKISSRWEPKWNPCHVIDSMIGEEGLVADWLFYYGGGDTLYDVSGNNNHGTIKGAVWKDGRYGWALVFDGTNYVEVPDSTSISGLLSPGSKFTVSFWVYVDAESDAQIMGKDKEWGVHFVDNVADDGYISPRFDTWGDNTGDATSENVPVGEWRFLVFIIDAGDTIKLYQNGSLDYEDTVTDTSTDTSNPLGMGGTPGVSYYPCKIAFTRIFTTMKSASWVSRRFERTKGIFGL